MATARPHRWHWTIVAGAASLMVAATFVFYGTIILLPEVARGLDAELSRVMVYPSLQSLAGVFSMSLLAPRMYRWFGVRASIVGGGIWLVGALVLAATATNLTVFYIAGFAYGIASGPAMMMASSLLINTWFEERRGTMMGIVFAVAGLGGVAGGVVLPLIVSGRGYAEGFWTLAIVLVAMVVVPGILFIRSHPADVGLSPFGAKVAPAVVEKGEVPAEPGGSGEPHVRDGDEGQTVPEGAGEPDVRVEDEAAATLLPPAPAIPGVPANQAFRSLQFVALAVAIVGSGVAIAIQQHYPAMFVGQGVSSAAAGTLMSVMAMTSVFTNMAIGTLNDRKGTLVAVMVCFCAQFLSLVTFSAVSGFVPLALAISAFALGMSFTSVLVPITVMQMFGPRAYATILGPIMAATPAGMALGAPLWGVVAESSGSYTLPLLIGASITAVSMVLLGWAIRTTPGLRKRVELEGL